MIAVVSHDAGGAEVVSSYVKRNSLECLFAIKGPAIKIFSSKLGNIHISNMEDAVEKSEWVLTGTGWQTHVEVDAIQLARKKGKKVISFIDHWINYKERFEKDGMLFLPDEIWVGDVFAQKMASTVFPDTKIVLVNNPYFEDIQNELINLKKESRDNNTISILFVSEPLSELASQKFGNPRHYGYTEVDALRYFLNNIHILGKENIRVVIRPHPAEAKDKYQFALDEYNFPIEIGGTQSLLSEISACDLVVGCQSMAMVIGVLAGKKVICSIPATGRPCVLPQVEIMNLTKLIESKNVKDKF